MSNIVIQVQNLSKQYRLGEIGTGSLAHDVNRWWYRIRGKENPYLKIGEVNDRTVQSDNDYVWALKDINFEVKQGEVLGIIGRNGAGKSTLLKILSKTTAPTTGQIKIKGRIASLLEVGTGFHPELSGRDNIFLNGAILGMTKKEIQKKFDEIVDFAGVERYIDTPVKRYSSGMYVRLAFAVAAHLEPEILIVDEVLAVGDAEFQKKCLGKMKDVSVNEGRTVLFVSHNMTAVKSLCQDIIFLKNGFIEDIGKAEKIINSYIISDGQVVTKREWRQEDYPGDNIARLIKAEIIDESGINLKAIDFSDNFYIEIIYDVLLNGYVVAPNIHLFDKSGEYVFVAIAERSSSSSGIGRYKTRVKIPRNFLNNGRYSIGIACTTLLPHILHFYEKDALEFDIVEDMENRNNFYRGDIPGVIRPELFWETMKIK